MEAARYAWGREGVTMPAIFPSTSEMAEVEKFYRLRER
jgi:hypothetical protein